MTKTTVWILGDQLSPRISSLAGLKPEDCIILMVESLGRGRKLPYHPYKLILLWSAMRHFARELREMGYTVDYYPAQPGFVAGLEAHLEKYAPVRLRLMESAEYGGAARLAQMVEARGFKIELTSNNMFLSDRAGFAQEAKDKKGLLLERFYRQMRRQTGLLMADGNRPEGDKWNYDRQNRQTPGEDHQFPGIPRFAPDELTRQVIALVTDQFPDHFGRVNGFWLPVTRRSAEAFLEDFLQNRLDLFGPYEDAMVSGEPALYHSLLSPLLNIGLLDPLAVCRRAEEKYRAGEARLNSVEGFIRQIIGWREFIYQVYHLKMPGYIEANALAASLPLPDFYWTAETDMACIADAVRQVQGQGLNHHIQRLMITGNFALMAGIDPQAVNDWYWLAYVDAYEWVVTPNVLGLSLYADGGLLATKPYAASANYIHKMSNYCPACAYNHRQAVGDQACPFNALYWDFLARNRERFKNNPRMNLMMAQLDRRDQEELNQIRSRAAKIREMVRNGGRI